jgi:thiol:disulfide interchange protein DsbD
VPTSLELELPAGWKASEVLYPVPEDLSDPNVAQFGYTGSVLLVTRVTPPADLAPTGSVTIAARASWLCCERQCIPGDATVRFAAEVGARSAADPEGAALLERWRPRFPRDVAAETSGSLASGRFEARVRLASAAGKLEVFAAAPDELQVRGLSARAQENTVSVVLEARVLEGMRLERDDLEVVLVQQPPGGERGGVRFRLPLGRKQE